MILVLSFIYTTFESVGIHLDVIIINRSMVLKQRKSISLLFLREFFDQLICLLYGKLKWCKFTVTCPLKKLFFSSHRFRSSIWCVKSNDMVEICDFSNRVSNLGETKILLSDVRRSLLISLFMCRWKSYSWNKKWFMCRKKTTFKWN